MRQAAKSSRKKQRLNTKRFKYCGLVSDLDIQLFTGTIHRLTFVTNESQVRKQLVQFRVSFTKEVVFCNFQIFWNAFDIDKIEEFSYVCLRWVKVYKDLWIKILGLKIDEARKFTPIPSNMFPQTNSMRTNLQAPTTPLAAIFYSH